MDYNSIKTHFKIKDDKGDVCRAVCPSHPDKEASLSVKYDKVNGKTILKCFAGCETEEICEAAGLKVSDLFDKELSQDNQKSGWDITNVYKYLDEDENLLFEKIKYKTKSKPKCFSQRRYVGEATLFSLDEGTYYETYNGSNSWSMKQRDNAEKRDFPGCRRVIYNLPYVIAAIKTGREVYIVEGEKDADNLKKWGLVATCNPDGASKSTQKPKWRKEFNQYFKGAQVIILHDNDDAGRTHAENIAANLFDVAEYVKCPELDGLDEKGDISDWQEQGHTKEDLISLIENTEIWDPSMQPENVDLIRYNFSDVGNAERLLAMYGKIIRYKPGWKNGWLIWSGKHWQSDCSGKIEELARKTIKKLQQQGYNLPKDDEHVILKKEIQKFVLRSESDNKIKAMINQAKSHTNITLININKNVYLLNLKNGTLNLKTGELQRHERRDYITKLTNLVYDPEKQCPNWLEFINKIFLNNEELIDYVQKSIGYSMTGDANLQCFYICHGQGANGKGTFMNTIKALLGDYAGILKGNSLMEKMGDEGARGDLAKLEGKYFVCVNELEEGKSFDEALVKSLTSGADEAVPVRRMYEEEFDMYPTFKMWMTTNKLPKIKGTDNGIWRRVRKIPFEYDFEKDAGKDEKFFENKLIPELSGILNWAVEGCLKWQKEGMTIPDIVKYSTDDYRNDMDPVQRFLDDECIVSETCKSKISELYDSWENWAKKNNEYVLSSIKLGKKLVEKGFKKVKNTNGWYWLGIGISDSEHQCDMEEIHNKVWPFKENE